MGPLSCLNFSSRLKNFGSKSREAKAYDRFSSGKVHKSEISHESLAAAASFAATRELESTARSTEGLTLLAGFAGAFIDKVLSLLKLYPSLNTMQEVETHGIKFIDKEMAKYDGASSEFLYPSLVS
ncbi:hypothetical protein B0H13DRAFT_1958766 [Mycena leptocephala]|nr:hypothetical protein B0H13DRAFT_1958766 [Mycena leptocephala]